MESKFLILMLAVCTARSLCACKILLEVHSSSWSGDTLRQLEISFMKSGSEALQCLVLGAKQLLSDQFLVISGDQGIQKPRCIVASRSGALCRRLMPPNESSPCCTRVFVTSLSGCMISIQRRVDNSTSFVRNWTEYAAGYGLGPQTNHWIGLNSVHSLTWPSGRPVRIRMKLWNDTELWANYTSFRVDSEANKFRLSISGFSASSGLGDCMDWNNNMMFSTFDSDNDLSTGSSCSAVYFGGWWYNACHHTNPNGIYVNWPSAERTQSYVTGIIWKYPFGFYYFMKEFEMLLG